MKNKEDFSCAIIARNEETTLPRLIKSIEGVSDIVIVDTGSTDKTVEVARSLGCRVFEEGDRFKITPTEEQAEKFKELFGFEPTFKTTESYFNFSKARNYAISKAKNDWVFQSDADEVVIWDIDKVRAALPTADHFVYRFCYAHKQPDFDNPDWSCALEFTHSKFFRKSMLEWKYWVHELPVPRKGKNPRPPLFVDFIHHHHWQNPGTGRGHYLPGLELNTVENPDDPRTAYYIAREFFYGGL